MVRGKKEMNKELSGFWKLAFRPFKSPEAESQVKGSRGAIGSAVTSSLRSRHKDAILVRRHMHQYVLRDIQY